MDWLLQFLTSESTLAWIIAGTLLGLLALVVIVGLAQGRESVRDPDRSSRLVSSLNPQRLDHSGSRTPGPLRNGWSGSNPRWEDDGRPVEVGGQEPASNHPKRLSLRVAVVSVGETSSDDNLSGAGRDAILPRRRRAAAPLGDQCARS